MIKISEKNKKILSPKQYYTIYVLLNPEVKRIGIFTMTLL
jgi:hypothetical protein